MLTHHRRPVCLSFISTDLPILSTLETAATLYQKDNHRFHLLLNQPEIIQSIADPLTLSGEHVSQAPPNRWLWLEISPYRAILTMQGDSKFAYRHFWEKGVYGISRYWLNSDKAQPGHSFRLRNFTRNLKLEGDPLPEYLRVEYELWSEKVQLGHYVLHLEIYH
jgi:hypothetical protein